MARAASKKREADAQGLEVDSDLAGAIEDMPQTYIRCRELMHNWEPFTVGSGENGGFIRVLQCDRCAATKDQTLDSYGRLVSTKITYPEGYLMEGHGRILGDGRDLLRLTSIRRDFLAANRRRRSPAKKKAG